MYDVACQSLRASIAHSVRLAISCIVQILNFENYYFIKPRNQNVIINYNYLLLKKSACPIVLHES